LGVDNLWIFGTHNNGRNARILGREHCRNAAAGINGDDCFYDDSQLLDTCNWHFAYDLRRQNLQDHQRRFGVHNGGVYGVPSERIVPRIQRRTTHDNADDVRRGYHNGERIAQNEERIDWAGRFLITCCKSFF
jgi:hypothetical protein